MEVGVFLSFFNEVESPTDIIYLEDEYTTLLASDPNLFGDLVNRTPTTL